MEKENFNITSQIIIQATFYDDKVSLYRMIVLINFVVKNNHYDYVTCVNNRDNPFHVAKALAVSIAMRKRLPFKEIISDQYIKATNIIKGKKVLIIDDVIYKGRTMKAALDACTKQKPLLLHFLAFGKSSKFA